MFAELSQTTHGLITCHPQMNDGGFRIQIDEGPDPVGSVGRWVGARNRQNDVVCPRAGEPGDG